MANISGAPSANVITVSPATRIASGSDGDDILVGGDGDDTLIGGGGSDVLLGGAGSDVYRWFPGDGYDLIVERAAAGSDTLELVGVSASQISIVRSGVDIRILVNTGAGLSAITVSGELLGQGRGIEFIKLADMTLNREDFLSQILTRVGSGGADTIVSTLPDETIIGGRGNDLLIGGAGSNVYRWTFGDGDDRIVEGANLGVDILDLSGVASTQVTVSKIGTDVRISIQGGASGAGGVITLAAELLGDGRGVESVRFADTVWSRDDLVSRALTITGTSGNDVLQGGNLDETLIGGAGSDLLLGGGGSDLYRWRRGDGSDVIAEGAASGTDVLDLSDINSSQVSVVRVNSGTVRLIIRSDPASAPEYLTLNNQLLSDGSGVELVKFADATWTRDDLNGRALTVTGTSGKDTLSGSSLDETFVGGKGDDVLTGGGGADVYRWSFGDGDDRIVEGATSGADVLDLVGVSAAQARVTHVGDDVLVTIAGPDGSQNAVITLTGQLLADGSGVESVRFSDQTWSRQDLLAQALTINGTSGNDILMGGKWDETIIGGAGSDMLMGGAGSDLYRFRPGDGFDMIVEGLGSGTDVLDLSDVQSSQVRVANLDNASVRLTIYSNPAFAPDYLDIKNQLLGNGFGVELINFADATWTRDDLNGRALTKTGTSGKDTLSGSSLDETFIGGRGDDLLTGGGGHDTFVFSPAMGRDVITDFNAQSAGGKDVLQFDRNLFASWSDVLGHAAQSGSDVVITANAQDVLTLRNVTLSALSAENVRFV